MKPYERLMRYATIPSASDAGRDGCPSTPCQWDMLHALQKEMETLGVEEITLDENGYLFGTIPATVDAPKAPVLGLLAHVDVVADAPSVGVKPQLVHYAGGDITVNAEAGIVMQRETYPALAGMEGEDLVMSDGTTLLGADDKAGIAEIMTMAERLLSDRSIPHGKIRIGFTPDEEIGRGPILFDVAAFGADYAYTLDGWAFGDITTETFHAVQADVTVHGVSVHTGQAKDVMLNAAQIASEFATLLPEAERPEHTEGHEGFFHLHGMSGTVEEAHLVYLLRDYAGSGMDRRMALLADVAGLLSRKYGEGTVEVAFQWTYRNMAEKLKDYPFLTDIPVEALREMGHEPHFVPQRGGTDGAQLSFKGLPCPNLGCSFFYPHGRMEFANVQQMDRVTELLIRMAEKFAQLEAPATRG